MRPTLYHGPLPRMKPQPIHVTGMIVSRKKAREKRMERQRKLLEDINVLQIERDFEVGLVAESPNPAEFEAVFSGNAYKEWGELVSLYILQSSVSDDESSVAYRRLAGRNPRIVRPRIGTCPKTIFPGNA
jgi:hypothetical protein